MRIFLLILGGAMMWASAASADMDYRCLQLCARSGQNNSACMGQCALPDKKPLAKVDPAESATREFPMMRKLNRNEILPPQQDVRMQDDKDFDCVQQCLRANMRTETCERGCTVQKSFSDKDNKFPNNKDTYILGGQKPNKDKTQLDIQRLVPSPKDSDKAQKPLAPLDSLPHVKGW